MDVQEAGEGNLEISIMCGDRNIQNHVKQLSKGRFEVSYTPMEGGPHNVIITFNEENVPGSRPHALKVYTSHGHCNRMQVEVILIE